VAAEHGAADARRLVSALRETVLEVGRVCHEEGIDAAYHRGGTLTLARNAAQERRGRAAAVSGAEWGDGTVWLEADEAAERLAATSVRGATYNPHCARVQPRRLVDGLARVVLDRGATVVEGARVASTRPGVVRLSDGRTVRAAHVIRATEAWTARMPRLRREVAPVYSLMVATQPLEAGLWDQLGLRRFETFADHRHVIVYGQRTVDDRIAFGGRGAPYHHGSAMSPAFDRDERIFALLRTTLLDLLPQLRGTAFTHAWGGPLGIARDWHPSVGLDPTTGLGWAGGYVGDGVAATNLAGRTLADLLCGRRTEATTLPWVGHRSPRWEPEPARWLGINGGMVAASAADREESLTGRPAMLAPVLSRLTGH
jgi:glycine/D-amino acid oxidase-like deaminating enzyme